MFLVYSTSFISRLGFLQGSFILLDDWLKRDRFVFIGWSGLILFPTSYLSVGSWFTGTSFITSWFTHGLASSYIEGYNFNLLYFDSVKLYGSFFIITLGSRITGTLY
jgi:hypothetical protein